MKLREKTTATLLIAIFMISIFTVVMPVSAGGGSITLDDAITSLHFWDAKTTPNAWAWNTDIWQLTIATSYDALVEIKWFDWYPTQDVYELWIDGDLKGTNTAGLTGEAEVWLSLGIHEVEIVWIYYRTNQQPIPGGSYYDITFTVIEQRIPIDVDIDIKPGSDPNSVNLGANGLLPVAILGSISFDVNDVDISKPIILGDANLATRGKAEKPACSYEDVNGDGFTDLMTFFPVNALGLIEGDTALTLDAKLLDETPIVGSDFVRIVPPE